MIQDRREHSANVRELIMVNGRILFADNPWPDGHSIEKLTWGATLHPAQGLFIHFDLVSAPYCDGDHVEEKADGTSDWHSKSVWANYHACHIAPSMTSDCWGILVSDGSVPFDLDLPNHQFHADLLPTSVDHVFEHGVFGIYLLGHDACADHRINLARMADTNCYSLNWSGRIALAYADQEDFRYTFTATAENVVFDAISLWYCDPVNVGKEIAGDFDLSGSPAQLLAPFVSEPDRFRFVMREGHLFAERS